ncbi:MAG: hydrogenase maturation protease [Candidatus Methanomethylophilaceae archaeon]|nr:hydrogenase maturation protease [Candidatus Methanomethylophilaceae archaeon]
MEDRILVIGLGSPIMSDDAIGLKVVEELEAMRLPNVITQQEAIGGLDIIPMVMDHRKVIIVDAIQTFRCLPGTITVMDPDDFQHTISPSSAHEMNLPTAMHLGRQLEPERMPEQVRFVAIEVEDLLTVSEEMTSAVRSAAPEALATVLRLIDEMA